MPGKESRFRGQLEEGVLDALCEFLEVASYDVRSANRLEEQRVTREERISLLTVETDTPLTVSRRVNDYEIRIQQWIPILEKEVGLWKVAVQRIKGACRLGTQWLKQRPIGVSPFWRQILAIAAVDSYIDLYLPLGVVVYNVLSGAGMVEMAVSEDDSGGNDVENLQAFENLLRLGPRIKQHALLLPGRNHIGVCVEWTNNYALDHIQ